MCCECDCVFKAATHNLISSTCRCVEHSRVLRARNRPRYTGTIPLQISQPIRTGLLQCIDNDDLVEAIAFLIIGDNQHAIAEQYIKELSQFPRERLLDGGFWWEDHYHRKNGIRYTPITKDTKRRRKNSDAEKVNNTTVAHMGQHTLDDSSDNSINVTGGEQVAHPVPQPAVEIMGQLTIWDNPATHIWDNVVHLTKDDPKMIWQIWDMHIAPVLGFPPDGIATFHKWKAAYDWNRGHQLLLGLADRLSVRYNHDSLLTASNFEYEDLLVAVIGHIRNCNTEKISSYVAKLLGTVSIHSQLVD